MGTIWKSWLTCSTIRRWTAALARSICQAAASRGMRSTPAPCSEPAATGRGGQLRASGVPSCVAPSVAPSTRRPRSKNVLDRLHDQLRLVQLNLVVALGRDDQLPPARQRDEI